MLAWVQDGQIVRVGGDPDHPVTRGAICGKANRYVERIYSPDRVLYPQRRVGPKGAGQFERISWDEALDLIAERFHAIVREHGAEAILPYSFAGTMGITSIGSMDRRLFHRLGASQLARTVCSVAGNVGYDYTIGRQARYRSGDDRSQRALHHLLGQQPRLGQHAPDDVRARGPAGRRHVRPHRRPPQPHHAHSRTSSCKYGRARTQRWPSG